MAVRLGVVDIGSNTIRLLVADVDGSVIVAVEQERVRLALGEEIERAGRASALSIAAAAKSVRRLCGIARRSDVDSLDVFVTAPGRQSANSDELVAALSTAAAHPVRILSIEEEGRLAYEGALATVDFALPERIAVCDVGGASTEIAVGSPGFAPDWVGSVELGAVRLSARTDDLELALHEAAAAFAQLRPPPVEAALAVGGSARAARRMVGTRLGEAELMDALLDVDVTPPDAVAQKFGVGAARARILPAGVAILAQVQELLGVPLHVCSGGLREGAVLAGARALAA